MRNILLLALILAAGLYILLPLYTNRAPSSPEIPFSSFVAEVKQGHVDRVVISDGENVNGTLKDGKPFHTYVIRDDTSYFEPMLAHGVTITVQPRSQSGLWANLATTLLPFVVLIGLWFLMSRQRWTRS